MTVAVKPKTHVAIVLDRSGSMQTIRNDTVLAYNNTLESIRQRGVDQDVTITLVQFANRADTIYAGIDPKGLKPLTNAAYGPSGQTALFDGIMKAVEDMKGLPYANDDATSFLVIVITDGDENNSHTHTAEGVKRAFKTLQNTDRWTFAIHLPPGRYKEDFIRRFGIPTDNLREWEATKEGTHDMQVATQSGLDNFFTERKKGVRSVQKFFATTDLSKVDADVIKANLVDISKQFKSYELKAEGVVKEFVEEKTKKPYVIGSTYYLLMKPEKVQSKKAVLIVEKGSAVVWGGPEARKLIGIPDGVDVKVTPGNHSNYDIYVQSTSVNRKLPRGTKVMVDTKHDKDIKPTWDHTVVKPKEFNPLAAV